MVGSSISEDDRTTFSRRFRVGFVLLVAASGGLVTLQADPTPMQFGAAVVAGLVVGLALLGFLLRSARQLRET